MKQPRLKTLILGTLLFLICAIISFFALLSHSLTALQLSGLPPAIIYLALTMPFVGLFLAITRILIGINIPNTFIPLTILIGCFTLGVDIALAMVFITLLLAYLAKYLISEFHLHFAVKTSLIMTLVLIGLVILLKPLEQLGLLSLNNSPLIIVYSLLTIAIINEKFLTFKMTRSSLWTDLTNISKTLTFSLICFILLGGSILDFQWNWLEETIINYPESVFGALLLTILIGRYTGLRLSEIFRFRKLIFKNN